MEDSSCALCEVRTASSEFGDSCELSSCQPLVSKFCHCSHSLHVAHSISAGCARSALLGILYCLAVGLAELVASASLKWQTVLNFFEVCYLHKPRARRSDAGWLSKGCLTN